MNMKRFCKPGTCALVVLMLLTASLTDNALHAGEPPLKKDIQLNTSQRRMLENNNDFACDLLRTVTRQQQGSTIVSPISVSYMLGMLNAGAQGETQRQIADVLGMGDDVKGVNTCFKKLIDGAPYLDAKAKVRIANAIFANSGLGISLVPQYKIDMETWYNAQIEALDFGNSRNVNVINDWCDTHTNGMIPKILDRLTPDAAMYLLNAVYFKATWAMKFDPDETHDRNFTKQNRTTVMRPMMHLKTRAAYSENGLYKMLSLPYGDKAYSMWVILPDKGISVNEIIDRLTAQELKQQRHAMRTVQVDILIPRFTTTSDTDLKDVLSSMGMPLAFDRDFAEFPNMAQNRELYVSMMKQKARIEVNEEGTKAAAVTIAQMTNRSASSAMGYTFHATRPFIYFIVEEGSGAIFFMGTYCGD